MNAKDNRETYDQALVIEDLSVENAEEIQGGAESHPFSLLTVQNSTVTGNRA